MQFDGDCRHCDRLADFLDQVKVEYPNYHARPVAPFGDPNARLLIVGLAPGMHGANATGRPFTGDHAGLLLYATLYRFGFSNQPRASSKSDGLILKNCCIDGFSWSVSVHGKARLAANGLSPVQVLQRSGETPQ